MANGSCDGGGDDGVEVEGGIVATSQTVFEQLLCFDGLQDDVEVEGEGGVVVRSMRLKTLSSFWRRRSIKVKAYWKEAELKRVEDIVRGRLVRRKLVGLVASVRRLSEESLQVLSSFITLKNFGSILQIAFGFPCLV